MSTAAPARLRLRVVVGELWAPRTFEAAAGESVSSLKGRVLTASRIAAARAGDYEVKVGGALVRDESQGLAAAGVSDGGQLIVLARRRRPVR